MHVRVALLLSASALLIPRGLSVGRSAEVEIRVVDEQTGQPVAVRMHLRDARGRPRRVRHLPWWHDHFTFDGKVILKLPVGHYTFQMERGPEYRIRSGHFTIERGATDNKQVTMHRFVDMAQAGWWSGDLQVQRSPRDVPLLMEAEDLYVAELTTWSNQHNDWAARDLPSETVVRTPSGRFMDLMAGRDQRSAGTLLFFRLPKPLPLPALGNEQPSPLYSLNEARQFEPVHVDLANPYAWDLPLWVATGKIDSIGLANGHLWRDGGLDKETGGRPRDRLLYPAPLGNGRWAQDIYYHLLNCGLRIPPSAGSASGIQPNPVGYNRVYVHCGDELTYDKWWDNLRAGHVVVTNGPLLQPRVNGQLPGYVFRAYDGEKLELTVTLHLATRDKIDYLEIVKNGDVAEHVRLDKWAEAGGSLPPMTFQSSGWMLVRAVTNHAETYRYATTGPYYVLFDNRPRVSRRSAQFFLDWLYDRARQIRQQKSPEQVQLLTIYRKARDFWQELVDEANAD